MQKTLTTVGVFLLALLLYWPFVGAPFFPIDDALLILNNPHLTSGTWSGLKKLWISYDPELYLPLTLTMYFVEYALVGAEPSLFHATNIFLHALNGWLVYKWLQLLTKQNRISLAIATIFIVHPIHTPTVLWIAARKDLLSSTFILATLISYTKYLDTPTKFWGRLSLITTLLGLLAKVSALSIPLLLLLIDYYRHGPPSMKQVKNKWPYFLLGLIFLLIALGAKTLSVYNLSYYQTALLGIVSSYQTLVRIVLPFKLSLVYPFTENISLLNPTILFPVLISSGLLIIAIVSRALTRTVFFGTMFFLFALLPHQSNFVYNSFGTIHLGTDRYAYLASIGLIFIMASALSRWRLKGIIWGGCLMVLFGLSFTLATAWLMPTQVFYRTLHHYPQAHLAHYSLGYLENQTRNFRSAQPHLKKALALEPNDYRSRTLLGNSWLQLGDYQKAATELKHALKLAPDHYPTHNYLALNYLRQGQTKPALKHLGAALEIEPNPTSMYLMGRAFELEQNLNQAQAWFLQALELDPNHAAALQRLEQLINRP